MRVGGSSTRYSSGCAASQAGLARKNASTKSASAGPSPGPSTRGSSSPSGGLMRDGSGDVLTGLGPVGEECRKALFGQRMIEQLPQHRRRYRDDVRAQLGGIDH